MASAYVIRRILYAVVPLVLFAAAAEVTARFMGPGSLYNVGGPLGWTAQPNLLDHWVIQDHPRPGFLVSTNADGLRTSYGRERRAGVRRVVLLGESTIFGWGNSLEGTLADRLELLLGKGWEVVNAGQPGFSSEQTRLLAEMAVPAYQPDGVVFFFPWNDFSAAAKTDRETLTAHPALLASGLLWDHSALLRWAWARRAESTDLTVENPLMQAIHGDKSASNGINRTSAAQRLDNLAQMVRITKEGGAWLIVASLPPGARYSSPEVFAPVAEIEEGCASLGVPFVDLSHEPRGWSRDETVQTGDWGHFTDKANFQFTLKLAGPARDVDARARLASDQ